MNWFESRLEAAIWFNYVCEQASESHALVFEATNSLDPLLPSVAAVNTTMLFGLPWSKLYLDAAELPAASPGGMSWKYSWPLGEEASRSAAYM